MRFFVSIWQQAEINPQGHLDTVEISKSLSFGTQLNGGFANASFTVPGTKDQSYQRYRTYLGAAAVIFDQYGDRIYEGKVTKVAKVSEGLRVDLSGYYTEADNLFFDMIYIASEATTNLVVNPSFEVNVTDGWSITGGTRTRVTTEYLYGSACAKLTQITGGETKFFATINVSPNSEYTMGVWVKNLDVQGTCQMKIEQRNSGGSIINTSAKTLVGLSTSSWVFLDQTITTLPTAASVYISIVLPANPSPGSLYVDGIQFENKSYSTEYCDGSLGPLFSWAGTAHNSISSRQAYSATVGDVVKDCVDLMSSSWSPIEVFLSDADAVVDTQDFTDKKVKDGIETALKFGYSESDLRPVYFAIWDNRIPHLFPEPFPDDIPDWFVSTKTMGSDEEISQSTDGIYNRVFAAYDNQNSGPSKTLPAEDTVSQYRYGIREGLVQNGNNPEGLAMAESLRDMALERFKAPRQLYTLSISGLVRHNSGYLTFPYKIRAGDTVMITDADIMSTLGAEIGGLAKYGLFGFVVKTEYSSEDNSMKIDFGTSDVSFETVMSRLGLSGGLS